MSEENAAEQMLEPLLQDWAARHTLSAARSKTIQQAILMTPEPPAIELTVDWWRQVFGNLAATMQQSTNMNCYLRYMNG